MGFLGRWSLDKSDKGNVEMKDHESNDVEEKLEPDQDDIKEKKQSVPVMNKFNLNWHSGIKLSGPWCFFSFFLKQTYSLF